MDFLGEMMSLQKWATLDRTGELYVLCGSVIIDTFKFLSRSSDSLMSQDSLSPSFAD
jgi:hypothetical protein